MIEKTNQNMSVFNEVATSVYLYITILLTEFMGETGLRDQFGWALLILVGGVVVVNFLRVISNIPSFLKTKYKRVKNFFKKDTDRTVSIRPTPQASDLTAADLITVTNSIDFNSRDPMEREYLSKISIKNVKTT
jgi:hypothetical protein